MPEFVQEEPRLGNQYDDDALLRAYLRWKLPASMLGEIEPDLRRLGQRVVTDILALAAKAEASPPHHIPFDAWGRRVDRIETSEAWRELDRVSATEAIVATAYERAYGWRSRIDQFARLYLFAPSSALYSCPLAMTDGAARFLQVHGGEETRSVFEHLTSRDPGLFWTSGQWMTERTGGSDVGSTSTIARCESGNDYRLSGSKWFTSATTSQVAMTLARIEGAPAGGSGLSVFLIKLRDPDGTLRNIRVERLKDKLGTRALPTAELALDGTPALLVGGAGDGIRKIATLFNITRVYNAVAAVGGMRRAIALATDYASRRSAFGKRLVQDEAALGLDRVGATATPFPDPGGKTLYREAGNRCRQRDGRGIRRRGLRGRQRNPSPAERRASTLDLGRNDERFESRHFAGDGADQRSQLVDSGCSPATWRDCNG